MSQSTHQICYRVYCCLAFCLCSKVRTDDPKKGILLSVCSLKIRIQEAGCSLNLRSENTAVNATPLPRMASALRLAVVQLGVTASKTQNLERAGSLIRKAVKDGANLVALPECFNSPYGTQFFRKYAEKIPGESTDFLSKIAVETKAFIIGGSIPEEDGGKIYNTSTVYDPEGNMIAKHRKLHLFDIDIPGKITFKESDVLTAGSSFTTFDTPFCKVGIGICYDMRFPEVALCYTKLGCKLIVYPGAFNMTTGAAHWEAIQRGRAIDNQLYVATVSPARIPGDDYVAWGHSMIISPWGEVIAEAQDKEEIVVADLDLGRVDEVREQVPVSRQKRADMYQVDFRE